MKRLALSVLTASLLFAAARVQAGDPRLAPTPPMGWNSWDSYARTITEARLRTIAEKMAKELKPFGWRYLVIDEGWYVTNPLADRNHHAFVLDEYGRFVPVLDRFPSARGGAGLKPLADYIHSLGLQFGLHIVRGIPREAVAHNFPIAGSSWHASDAADASDICPWNNYNFGVRNNAAGQAYDDSITRLYAGWGVDFIKADCIANNPYKPDEIRMLRLAIKKSGRRMLLSLSPGPTAVEHAAEVSRYAEMWRTCNDFWDHWGVWPGYEWSQGLAQQFATAAQWAPHVRPGAWPDADMLPLGQLAPHPGQGPPRTTRLTKDEQRTVMTLWSIARSPLIMGGDLLSLDSWTRSLLTNREVIAVDQHSTGNHPVITTEQAAIWIARPQQKTGRYLAGFNLSDTERAFDYEWPQLGLEGKMYRIRDLWKSQELGAAKLLRITLAPHASALYWLRK